MGFVKGFGTCLSVFRNRDDGRIEGLTQTDLKDRS